METTKFEDIEKTVDVIDKYFPKGDKRRGEAMVIAGIANMEGRAEMREIILNKFEKRADELGAT